MMAEPPLHFSRQTECEKLPGSEPTAREIAARQAELIAQFDNAVATWRE